MNSRSFVRSSFQGLVPQLKAGRRFQQRKQCSATNSSALCVRKAVSGASPTVLIALSNSKDTGALLSREVSGCKASACVSLNVECSGLRHGWTFQLGGSCPAAGRVSHGCGSQPRSPSRAQHQYVPSHLASPAWRLGSSLSYLARALLRSHDLSVFTITRPLHLYLTTHRSVALKQTPHSRLSPLSRRLRARTAVAEVQIAARRLCGPLRPAQRSSWPSSSC